MIQCRIVVDANKAIDSPSSRRPISSLYPPVPPLWYIIIHLFSLCCLSLKYPHRSDYIPTLSILSWILWHSLAPISYILLFHSALHNLSVVEFYITHYSMIETMYSFVRFCGLELCIHSAYWDYVPVRSLGLCTHYVLIETMYLFFPSLGPYHSSYVTPSYSIIERTFLSNSAIPLTEDPKIHPPVLSFPLKYILRVDYFGFSHYSSFLSQAIIHTHLRSTFLIWNVDLMSFSYFPIPYDLSLFWASKPLPRSHSSLSCTSLLCRLTSRWHT